MDVVFMRARGITMNPIPSLSALGPRICILGPSNSGKSTMAVAIGRRCELPVVHLDQLHHQPHTAWRPRPEAEFLALHEQAIAGERWVIEGNYSRCMPARFARASGVILLDVGTSVSVWRYLRRALSGGPRAGALEGARDTVNWPMLHHLLVVTPRNRRRYVAMIPALAVPVVVLPSVRAIGRAWRAWALDAPHTGKAG
jgi:hypothetical protein